MCPGRVPTARGCRPPCARSLRTGANSAIGSRLPWIAKPSVQDADGVVDVDAPVHADHVAARPRDEVQHATSLFGKWMTGTPGLGHLGDEALRVRQHGPLVVARARGTRPSESNTWTAWAPASICAVRYAMTVSVVMVISASHAAGSSHMSRLQWMYASRRAALDHVARQRERRAGEADERHLVLELPAAGSRSRPSRSRCPRRDRETRSFATSAAVRTGLWMTGPSPFANSRSSPMPGERHQDVGEQDRGVDADEVDRLQRDLDGELGRPAHLEEAVLLADRAVLGEVATGLSHHPDRRVGRRARAGRRAGTRSL